MEEDELRIIVSKFIERCKKTREGKQVFQSIPIHRDEALFKSLILAIKTSPEYEIHAMIAESETAFRNWALDKGYPQHIAKNYRLYRTVVEGLLAVALVSFSESKPR